MKTQDYHLPFGCKVITKGNCILCNKELDEKDGLFVCLACQRSYLEEKKHEKSAQT
jgi:uncharacterized UBP type Zn finger protein